MKTLLISAYGCEPLKGSEPGVGWNWVLQMAKNNKLHVITRSNNEKSIKEHLPLNIAKNITFHYYDTNRFFLKLKNKEKGLYFYYFCWQLGIIKIINKLINNHDFDFSIHLTFGSIWLPTFLPFFNVPFIWGPIGGGEGIPKSFLSMLPIKDRIIQASRYFFKYLIYFNPFIIYPSYKATFIIARTNNTLNFIPPLFRKKATVFLETSMDTSIFNYKKENKFENKHVNIIITGRLVPFKNVITAIKSLAQLPTNYKFSLKIIGSGPEKKRIKNEIEILKLNNKVSFFEEMSRENVLKELSKSDIYLFPSLREGGTWALMEAMAIGLPVICLKWSGMEIITDDLSAIRIPVTNPKKMSIDMSNALRKLIDNPELRLKMGEAGRKRIKEVFNWEAKGLFINDIFEKLDK